MRPERPLSEMQAAQAGPALLTPAGRHRTSPHPCLATAQHRSPGGCTCSSLLLPCAHSQPEAFSLLKLFLPLGRERRWHSGRREKLKVEKPRTAGCTLPSLLSLISGYAAGGNRTTLQAHWHEAQTLHLSEHDALMTDWLSLWEVSWTQNHLLILILCLIHAPIYSTYGKRDPETPLTLCGCRGP